MIARVEARVVGCGPIEGDRGRDHAGRPPDEDVVDAEARPAVDGRRDETAAERPRVTDPGLSRRGPEAGVEQVGQARFVGKPVEVAAEDGRVRRGQRLEEGDDGPGLAKPGDVARRAIGVVEMRVGDRQRGPVRQAQPNRLDDPQVGQPSGLVEQDLADRAADEQDDAVPVTRVPVADGLGRPQDLVVERSGRGREPAVLVASPGSPPGAR